ncbi:MAG: cobalamin-dependent protein [Bacilli bacterium]|jgi:methanogenic corrinoid protein MtbC1|nr:cobalamin-dependent protein [Bacilli bacterium]MDD2682485.1 cobalamin-dependent protein [Bacilli bacterium]MDD3121732.1 cobalamin-dependent protein [Bacilli bacterium]MDD4482477.1 cobalamin-dependent protein [Bacilli bacterium]
MQKNYQEFLELLNQERKDECVIYIMELFNSGFSVKEVYEQYIIPSLAEYECNSDVEEICIWKEHTRTSIIRTILESSYPYLIKQKKEKINKSIIVACPQLEYHEIGAIINTNFFILEGFDAKYIGANTPSEQIISAVKILKPDYLALSITNYYNIVATKKLIETLKEDNKEIKVIIGGQATKNPLTIAQLKYDYILQSYEDIVMFKENLL